MSRHHIVALATSVILLAATAVGGELAVSTFDSGAEDWTTVGATSPVWEPTGGNPGGHIWAEDSVGGPPWFFVAPSKFLGDMSAAFGGGAQVRPENTLSR